MWCEHMCKVHEKITVRGVLFADHLSRLSYRVHHERFLQSSHQSFAWVPTRLVRPRQPHPVVGHRKSLSGEKRKPSSPQRSLSARLQRDFHVLTLSGPRSCLTPACATSSFGGAWAGAELVLLLGQPAWVSLRQDHALPRSPPARRRTPLHAGDPRPSPRRSVPPLPASNDRPRFGRAVWTP